MFELVVPHFELGDLVDLLLVLVVVEDVGPLGAVDILLVEKQHFLLTLICLMDIFGQDIVLFDFVDSQLDVLLGRSKLEHQVMIEKLLDGLIIAVYNFKYVALELREIIDDAIDFELLKEDQLGILGINSHVDSIVAHLDLTNLGEPL